MRVLVIILLLFKFSCLHCQEQSNKNNYVFLEGLGNGGNYSINYEKTLGKSNYSRTYIRAGFSVVYDDWIKPNHPNEKIPYFLTYNFPLAFGNEVGTKRLRYEYGLGLTTTVGENTRHYNMLNAYKNSKYAFTIFGTLGGRYYCKKAPVFFRVTLTPFYEILVKKYYLFWGGASVGLTF